MGVSVIETAFQLRVVASGHGRKRWSVAKDDGPRYTVSAVDRALTLMEALRDAPGAGVSELAERTGCTKSLTFRLLHTLEARGFVAKDAERRTYTLGFQAMLVGDQARRQSRLITAAEPFMDGLRAATGETVLLLVRDGARSACVARRTSGGPQRIFAEVGRRGPLHAGGGPKVLLAFAPDEVRAAVLGSDLDAYTARTLRGPALAEALGRIRREGWTVSEGELDLDKCSVAAPVMDAAGEAVAALSVVGPSERLADGARGRVRDAVVDAAHRLSITLGHRGAPVMVS